MPKGVQEEVDTRLDHGASLKMSINFNLNVVELSITLMP
jgi:hypothetical protein